MIKRISGLILALLVVGVVGCGRDDGERILGHWRADRVQLHDIRLPMGPDFVVTPNELMSSDGGFRIPIHSIASDRNTVTLDVPLFDLAFHFESANRIYFDIPLGDGRVYFQRITEVPASLPELSTAARSARPADEPEPASSPGPVADLRPAHAAIPQALQEPVQISLDDLISQAEYQMAGKEFLKADKLLLQARQHYGNDPAIDYSLALLHSRQHNLDSAIRSLRDAFQHGFRDFARLDASLELAPLRNDPRYNALVTRYR